MALNSPLHQFLSQTPPFTVLPPKELERLSSLSKEKTFKKGETIYTEGQPAESAWILREGRIQIFKYTTTSRPLAIESLGPNELFGTLCRIGSNRRNYPCTAITAIPSRVIQIPDQVFLDFYNHFPALVMGICALCSQRLNNVQGLTCQSQERVEKRVAMTLLHLYKQHGKTIPLTKREIGELSGTTVETAIRTLSGFAKKGWVTSRRGQITLTTPETLQTLIDED